MRANARRRKRFRSRDAAAAALMTATTVVWSPAWAGPPYLSDDPQPTDLGHWEIYNFAAGARGPEGLGGEAGIDLNYGGAKDLQLTAVLPLGFDNARGYRFSGLRVGASDIELAAKYRFLHQGQNGWTPDLAVFPRLFVPTGGTRYGTGHPSLLLPLWAQKDFGAWSVFGGGGYTINPGAAQRNFWQGGVAVARSLTARLQLGAELFGQTANTREGGAYHSVNFGLTYAIAKHWSLLASGGPTWIEGGAHGQVFYAALKADY